jgi:hypothetical protein
LLTLRAVRVNASVAGSRIRIAPFVRESSRNASVSFEVYCPIRRMKIGRDLRRLLRGL